MVITPNRPMIQIYVSLHAEARYYAFSSRPHSPTRLLSPEPPQVDNNRVNRKVIVKMIQHYGVHAEARKVIMAPPPFLIPSLPPS